MKLEYRTYGEVSKELLVLNYDSQIIYEGYTEDFVTSITGDLELNLNYGSSKSYSVVSRKYGDLIVWIPKLPVDMHYKCKTIIWTSKEFEDFWTFLKYVPSDDLEIIKEISACELKLVWLIGARGNEQINNYICLYKSVKKNIIALSSNLEHQNKIFNNLIEQDWLLESNKIIKCKADEEKFLAYLDKGLNEEWEVFRTDQNENLYVHLGNEFCLPINILIEST
ncbi:hypothetical protein [Sporosarcina cyprini]|uniref:hypothetical protein n=1 Tax=Sporosarcina cyprini TaxID=2910523 RepID=UPI001EDFD2C1|nr:hypothetical protein [Sporosarcina cyprini]MCG3089817.1 hypothetical protein [Sporosarcina cyprini]